MLCREVLEGRLSDVHHNFDDLTGEGERRLVLVGNGRASIAADIEAFVGRIEAADLFLEPAFADCLLVDSKRNRAPRLELALFVDFHFGGEHLPPRRNLVGRRNTIALFVVVVVLPMKLSVLHKEGPATAEAATAGEHAFGAFIRYHYLGRDRMVNVFCVWRRPLGHARCSRRIDEVVLPAEMAWLQRRIGALGEAVIKWKDIELCSLSHEAVLQVA